MAKEQIQELDKDLLDTIYSYKRVRETYEPMWYLSRKAYEGKPFTYWNRDLKQLSEIPVQKGTFNHIPEVSRQADSFENFFLSTDFVFTLIPHFLSDDQTIKEVMALSSLAQDYHKKLKESTIFADYIHYALMDNVSFMEVSPNDKKDDVEYKTWDAFDILFNPRIKNWSKQKLVIKVIKKRKEEVKKSKLYNFKELKSNTNGFFTWKDIFEREKYTQFTELEKDECLLFECFMITDQGLRIKTIDDAGNVGRDDLYEKINKIPVIPLRIYSGEWYQPSFVYRQIPMNRSLDVINNRFENLILRLSKGGWVVQEEENLDAAMNEEVGQIVRYSATKPDPIEMPQVPGFLMDYFGNSLGMAERYGISSIMSGQMPAKASGIRAGKMMDKITGQTQQANTSPINNMKTAVKQILEFTFGFLYEMWDTPKEAIYTDISKKMPTFISEKYKTSTIDENAIAIPAEFKRFDVDIDDGLGYTLDERKNTAMELFKNQVIGMETLKKIFKLGSSGYLMESEEKPLVEHPDMQAMIQNFPNMDEQQKQSLITTLNTLGQQKGNSNQSGQNIDKQVQDLMDKMGGGQPTPPQSDQMTEPLPQLDQSQPQQPNQ